MKKAPHCAHCAPEIKWYKRPLNITLIVTALILALSLYLPILEPFRLAFFEFWGIIWWAVILGLLIGGIIEVFIPREYISKYLAKSEKKTILFATLLGFVMSACSHGILAISMELYKKAMKLAPDANEKRRVLSGLGNTKSLGAMQMAAEYLEDKALLKEAEYAAVKIAESIYKNFPEQTQNVLDKIVRSSKNDSLLQQAQKVINQIKELKN